MVAQLHGQRKTSICSMQSFVRGRAGFNWCEALGRSASEASSPTVTRKKIESIIAKIWKWRSESKVMKTFRSLLECPRSLRLLLPSTQKRQNVRDFWNPTRLAGTGWLTATGKSTEIASIEIFEKTHVPRFLLELHFLFLICVKKQIITLHPCSMCGDIETKAQRDDHVATRLPRL